MGIIPQKNTVLLTAKEHFVCHHLLTKFTKGKDNLRMLKALTQFQRDGKNTNRNITARQFQIIKEANSKSMSGKNNPSFGKDPWNKGIKSSPHIIKAAREGAKRWRDNGGMSQEYKNKISKALKGRKKPDGFGEKLSKAISGKNHYRFKGYYHTPHGKLTASTEIEDIIPNHLVRRWCKNSSKIISRSSYSQSDYLQSYGPDIIGLTFEELGFYYEPI